MPKRLPVITYLSTLFLTGCSFNWLPGIYRLDIHQGNVVSQEMVDQLRPGMTKRQVAFIMGTPLLTDPFHDERWDYLYSNQPGNEPRVQKHISLAFDKDEELKGLAGDFRPGNLPSIEMSKDTTVNIPRIEREKTLWQKIKGVFGSED
ncbi:Beta-barrel assembly machine subunit BamE [Methylomagnum ishizawai]|uniref:Outer membrane protein assembly factor BamE n=1 Tax=Methylomagnum ishizawai TaxID=1760988 RepID=A0A1Y6CZX4_9GAMM|nr:outer membrane protein assembly factor BamE [Methylomagnum ishizawai]SMF95750.1 Beta-barrel assembly machine subunit BamE [Methylomagnum ishizawai]